MTHIYQTTHETATKTMTHYMVAGYIVLVDFRNKVVITSRNGIVLEKLTMDQIGTISQYEKHLAKVADAAATMKSKGL